jgi:hypothetical protein
VHFSGTLDALLERTDVTSIERAIALLMKRSRGPSQSAGMAVA